MFNRNFLETDMEYMRRTGCLPPIDFHRPGNKDDNNEDNNYYYICNNCEECYELSKKAKFKSCLICRGKLEELKNEN
jgi:hypothetical protein